MQMTSTNILYIYVIIINVVTFFIYGLDKSKAKVSMAWIKAGQKPDSGAYRKRS